MMLEEVPVLQKSGLFALKNTRENPLFSRMKDFLSFCGGCLLQKLQNFHFEHSHPLFQTDKIINKNI